MWIKRFFGESLYRRLILYFTLLMMIPIITAGSLIYRASDVRISDSALRLAAQVVEKDCESVAQVLNAMQSTANYVTADLEVQSILQETSFWEDTCDGTRIAALNARLQQLSKMHPEIDGIYLCFDNGKIARSRYYNIRQGYEQVRMSTEQYWSIRNHEDIQWMVSEEGSFVVDNMNNPVLGAARLMPLGKNGKSCGIVVVEVRQTYLNKVMRGDLGQRGVKYLQFERQGILLHEAEAGEQVIESAILRLKENAQQEKSKTFILRDRIILSNFLPIAGWRVVGIVFKSELRDESQSVFTIFLFITLLTFFINVVLSRFLADFELQPIRKIQNYIRKVEKGNFGYPLSPDRLDEIGDLAVSTQEMSVRIGELIETLKMEQERMRTAEFKALQAQINPHFLYNSLDSINWLIRRGDGEKASKMISALTTFFRIGLSKGHDVIPLQEELEHIRSYLAIQKIRYESQFEYLIYSSDEIHNCLVPKLMLQPLVENALYHGIKPCERKGMLIIQALLIDGHIEIEVLDNGAGMDGDTLNASREAILHTGQNKTNSYGVVSVNDRIQILAGTEYGLSFTSEQGTGTSVKIILPATQKGD